jgi:hypothetical protein
LLKGSSSKAPVTSSIAPQGLHKSHWPSLHPDLPIRLRPSGTCF